MELSVSPIMEPIDAMLVEIFLVVHIFISDAALWAGGCVGNRMLSVCARVLLGCKRVFISLGANDEENASRHKTKGQRILFRSPSHFTGATMIFSLEASFCV